MGVIHRHRGSFDWEGVSPSDYPLEKEMADELHPADKLRPRGVSVRWLIGPAEGAPNFALRYFEIEPGGWSSLDQHGHDHGVVILRGRGQVLLGERECCIGLGDVVYIPPYEVHQLRNIGDEPLGFLCIIPAREESA